MWYICVDIEWDRYTHVYMCIVCVICIYSFGLGAYLSGHDHKFGSIQGVSKSPQYTTR